MSDKKKESEDNDRSELRGRIDYEEIKKLIALLEEKNLFQFELELKDFKIKIARASAQPVPLHSQTVITGQNFLRSNHGSQEGIVIEPALAEDSVTREKVHYITSPMVGTFYRASSPASPPLVDIGDTVKRGQTLCIIEAMKLMNEIESDIDGKIVDILVENAKPVEYGQRIFVIEPIR